MNYIYTNKIIQNNMEQKLIEVNIEFMLRDGIVYPPYDKPRFETLACTCKYKKVNNNIRNKDFIFCCELLLLKEYKEFEKLIKNKYWTMDNGLLIIEAINLNNVDHFKYILDYIKIKNLEQVLFYCCSYGKHNIAIYLIDNNINFNNYEYYCQISTYSYKIDILQKYFHYIPKDKLKNVNIYELIPFGKYDDFKTILRLGYLINVRCIYISISLKKINFLLLLLNYCKINKIENNIIYDTINNIIIIFGFPKYIGNFDIIKILRGYRQKKNKIWELDPNALICKWDDKIFNIFIIDENIDNLKWLIKNKCPFNTMSYILAARINNIEILKILKENNCPFNIRTFIGVTEHEECKYGQNYKKWASKNNIDIKNKPNNWSSINRVTAKWLTKNILDEYHCHMEGH